MTTTAGVVETTGTHPFYVDGRGYVRAEWLREGDRLRGPGGRVVEVVSVQATGRAETVFNLAVAADHNYHVVTGGGQPILVHNTTDESCTPEDLYAFGNASQPRKARPSDFEVDDVDDIVGGGLAPSSPSDDVKGASTFISPQNAAEVGLTGQYHRLEAGSTLPDGLAVHADGADVGGNRAWGHRTIYPTREMPLSKFNDLFESMDWKHAGKIKK